MHSLDYRKAVLLMYANVNSMRVVARILKVSISSVSRWVKRVEPIKRRLVVPSLVHHIESTVREALATDPYARKYANTSKLHSTNAHQWWSVQGCSRHFMFINSALATTGFRLAYWIDYASNSFYPSIQTFECKVYRDYIDGNPHLPRYWVKEINVNVDAGSFVTFHEVTEGLRSMFSPVQINVDGRHLRIKMNDDHVEHCLATAAREGVSLAWKKLRLQIGKDHAHFVDDETSL